MDTQLFGCWIKWRERGGVDLGRDNENLIFISLQTLKAAHFIDPWFKFEIQTKWDNMVSCYLPTTHSLYLDFLSKKNPSKRKCHLSQTGRWSGCQHLTATCPHPSKREMGHVPFLPPPQAEIKEGHVPLSLLHAISCAMHMRRVLLFILSRDGMHPTWFFTKKSVPSHGRKKGNEPTNWLNLILLRCPMWCPSWPK